MESNFVLASVYLLRRKKNIYFWGQSQLKTCRKKILPKTGQTYFGQKHTGQTYFRQKQDLFCTETHRIDLFWTKQDKLYQTKTKQNYFGQKQDKLIIEQSFRDSDVQKPRRNKK